MKIALYVESEAYRWMADAAIASARQHMDAEIVHLTALDFPKLEGADTYIRGHAHPQANFLGRYFGLGQMLDGDVLYANCDVLFRADVSSVFDLAFAVAAPHIASRDVRFDGGIIFTREPDFFRVMHTHGALYGEERHVDEQLDVINKALQVFDVMSLPGNVYSYVPRNAADPCRGAAIVHYRGPRKEWMARAIGLDPAQAMAYHEGRAATHPGTV